MNATIWLQKYAVIRLAEGKEITATDLSITSPQLDMTEMGYTKIMSITIDESLLPSREDSIKVAMAALDEAETELRQQFEAKLSRLRASRENLLALPHVTSTVPPDEVSF